MKKKKIWYGIALCVFAVIVTLVLPVGLETATDTFVEWITQKEPESEPETGTEPESEAEPETGTEPESEPEPENALETETETQPEPETDLEAQQGLLPQTERTPEAGAVEYETDPPIPSEPEGGWQGREDLMYEGTGAGAVHEKTEPATEIPSQDAQVPAQSETPSKEKLDADARHDKGLRLAREAMNITYSETASGSIEHFIGSRTEQFENALSDYLYAKYEGFVEAERVDIVSFVAESEADLTYQIEVFATDGNSELFLCSYQKQIDAYGIYPYQDVTHREE